VTKTIISELASSVSAESDDDSDVVTDVDDSNNPVGWRSKLPIDGYASPLLWESHTEWKHFMKEFNDNDSDDGIKGNGAMGDHLWEQVKLEALSQLRTEPEAGPQLYQNILSQGSLVEAIVSIIARTFIITLHLSLTLTLTLTLSYFIVSGGCILYSIFLPFATYLTYISSVVLKLSLHYFYSILNIIFYSIK